MEFITASTFVAKTSEYVDKMWIKLCQISKMTRGTNLMQQL